MVRRLSLFAIGAACLISGVAQAQDRDVKFALDFISLGRHAPWYVALGKGFYKEEGLNVSILPSKGTADAIRSVATGTTEFGFIDIPSLVAAGNNASTVKIVAAHSQKRPRSPFVARPRGSIDSPHKRETRKVGRSTA